MLTKAVALLSQTFRVDVRQLRTHLLRGAIAGGVLWLLMVVHLETRSWSSPGLQFCEGLTFSTMAMITLMGAFYFPSVITEEKEEQTLGLLRMAGVSSLTLLLGKSVARLGIVLLLIAVSLPYWWLCVTLGGVTSTQVAAVAVSLAAYLALVSQIGTLCSVYFTTTGRACVASMIILFLLLFGPMIAEEVLQDTGLIPRGTGLFKPLHELQAPYQLGQIVRPGYQGGLLTTQVWSNLIAALGLFVLSWLLLDRLNTYDQVPGRESRIRRWLRSLVPAALRRRGARRAGEGNVGAAIGWKDFRQFGGGYRGWALRALAYLGVGILSLLDRWGDPMRRVGTGLIITAFWAGIAEIVYHAAHLFQREVKNQTWDSLRMLPLSNSSITRRKIGGALWALVPTLTALAAGLIMEQGLLKELTREFGRHPVISFCITLYCIATTVLAVYMTCYFSLRVNPWLGIVLSAGTLWFICVTPFFCCFGAMGMNGNDTAGFVFFCAAGFNLAIAAGCHIPVSATLNGETGA